MFAIASHSHYQSGRQSKELTAVHETKLSQTMTRPPEPPVRETSSNVLFSGARELLIRHSGELYRLRRTAKGGLILTK